MNLFKKLIQCKYKFCIDKKSDILIFSGWENVEILKKELKGYSAVFIHRKNYETNIFYLIIAIFLQFICKEQLKFSYIRAHIYFVKPKIILSTYEMDEMSFLFKKLFNTKTAIIQINRQNSFIGFAGELMSGKIKNNFSRKKNLPYEVDHMFVYGKDYEKRYSRFVKTKFHKIGAFRNNTNLKLNNRNKLGNSIEYISQYRSGFNYKKGFKGRQSYFTDITVIRFLEKYCIKKNLLLNINLFSSHNLPGRRGRWYKNKEEINFFKNLNLQCKHKYIFPIGSQGSYNNLISSNSKVIVTVDSNLGYEMLARGKKTVFFSLRDWDPNEKSCSFGWPHKYPKIGFFWANRFFSEKEYEKILNRVMKISNSAWEKKIKRYVKPLIVFDRGNKIFKKKLKEIIR